MKGSRDNKAPGPELSLQEGYITIQLSGCKIRGVSAQGPQGESGRFHRGESIWVLYPFVLQVSHVGRLVLARQVHSIVKCLALGGAKGGG